MNNALKIKKAKEAKAAARNQEKDLTPVAG